MIVSTAIQKMIEFYKGNRHDVNHFLKVWAMAKTIGELEGLDRHTQEVLELAAVIHDIACPLCREKYGDTDGKHQELESPALDRTDLFGDQAKETPQTNRKNLIERAVSSGRITEKEAMALLDYFGL